MRLLVVLLCVVLVLANEIQNASACKKKKSITTPLYYGFFTDNDDATAISKAAANGFRECVAQFPEYANYLVQKGIDVNKLFNVTNLYANLHVTAKFCGNDPDGPGVQEYMSRPVVSKSLNKAFSTEVLGYFATLKTIGAEVNLTSNQIELWGNDLTQTEITNNILSDPSWSADDLQKIKDLKLIENLRPGARAHMTLFLAPNQLAVQTGYDIIIILLKEKLRELASSQKVNNYEKETNMYTFNYLGDGNCLIKLKEAAYVQATFESKDQ